MNKTIYSSAALLGLFAVGLGAFGAHGLKNLVDAEAVSSFETGVRYQMYHAFLLFAIGLLPELPIRFKKRSYYLTLTGIVLFSFSIYLLALKDFVGEWVVSIAFLTPIGGLFLISSWGLLAYYYIRWYANKV